MPHAGSLEVINGSTQHFGPRDAEVVPPYTLKTFGAISQLIIPIKWDELPTTDVERQDIPVIPANSIITRTVVAPASEDFAGGTSYDVGLFQQDGTEIDDDGIFAALLLAQLNAGGADLATEGVLVGASIGAFDANVVIAEAVGIFTAGRSDILIEFMAPVVEG